MRIWMQKERKQLNRVIIIVILTGMSPAIIIKCAPTSTAIKFHLSRVPTKDLDLLLPLLLHRKEESEPVGGARDARGQPVVGLPEQRATSPI